MSAIVCGKRSIFGDIPASQVSKRIRFPSSSSPKPSVYNPFVTLSQSNSNLIEYLKGIFPDMDPQLLERALGECGDDLDLAIRSLNELRIGSAIKVPVPAAPAVPELSAEPPLQLQGPQPQVTTTNGEVPVAVEESLPKDGADWVELFVREMTVSANMDDARARASRLLGALESSIVARASSETAQSFHQEKAVVDEQVKTLLQENTILKRAVAIQHERQKEFDDRNKEFQQMKQLVSQYQDQLRTLEVNNYALTLHLKQAQQSNSIPGHFHPDVF